MTIRISGSQAVTACNIADGAALLDLDTSQYFKLNSVASTVWETIESSDGRTTTLAGICAAVQDAYDIDPEVCRADIEQLLQRMSEARLVTIAP